jgi:hypothetical protein
MWWSLPLKPEKPQRKRRPKVSSLAPGREMLTPRLIMRSKKMTKKSLITEPLSTRNPQLQNQTRRYSDSPTNGPQV